MEDISFSYDLNGNLTAVPAPYSITSATYDERNLPTSITRSGTTTSYRYSDDGQRYWKQSGSTTEHYALDGSYSVGGLLRVKSTGVVPITRTSNGPPGNHALSLPGTA